MPSPNPTAPPRLRLAALGFALATLATPQPTLAEESELPQTIAEEGFADPSTTPRQGLVWRIRGGAVYQFESSLEGPGSFDSTRAVLEAAARYTFDNGNAVGFSLGYDLNDYGFSDSARIDGVAPWNDVHALRASLPLFWQPNEKWSFLVVPRIRVSAERAQDWGDSLTGGAILGFSYRFSHRLRLGPGIGVTTDIEDGVNVFPIVVIDWRVTDRLRIQTGRGLGASRGPGILATYQVAKHLRAAVGVRRERIRFRLGPGAGVPNGVGQDISFPLLAGLSWGPPYARLSLTGGVEVGGELRLDDASGKRIAKSSYDPAGFLGFTFRLLL